MATSLLTWKHPTNLPSSSFAVPDKVGDRLVTAFRGNQNDEALFSSYMPQNYGGGTLDTALFLTGASSGNVDIDVEVEAVSSTDATDIHASFSFGAVSSNDNTALPTTGQPVEVVVTSTDNDSATAGDLLTLRVTRDGTNDTSTGNVYLHALELREQ